MTPIRLPAGMLGLVAVAALIAGCSSSGGEAAAGTAVGAATNAVGAATNAADAGTTTADAAAAGGGSVTCKQLTNADVQPVLVNTITSVAVTAAGTNSSGQQCVFSADAGGAIDVLVLAKADAANAYAGALQAETDGAVDVPGIGDKASRDKGDEQISSIKGNVYCSVTLGSAGDVPGIGALEAAAGGTSNIPDIDAAAAAAALGTICNRIFGSGNTTPDLSLLTAAALAASASAATTN